MNGGARWEEGFQREREEVREEWMRTCWEKEGFQREVDRNRGILGGRIPEGVGKDKKGMGVDSDQSTFIHIIKYTYQRTGKK